MKLWDLYYWNKHEYCWKWIGMIDGSNQREAIRAAKDYERGLVASNTMMKVEKCKSTVAA